MYSTASTFAVMASDEPMQPNERPPDTNTNPAPATPRASADAMHNARAGSQPCCGALLDGPREGFRFEHGDRQLQSSTQSS